MSQLTKKMRSDIAIKKIFVLVFTDIFVPKFISSQYEKQKFAT